MTPIPMLDLKAEYEYMKADIDAAIRRCLDHQKWILGPKVQEFEKKVADYLGVKHCIGASSGTDALVLALRALAIKTKDQEYFDRSDLIITTPFTFTATGDTILRAGATPLFVDIDPVTFNIDPAKIREFIKSEIRGILPVHLYGQSCQMDEIMNIAAEHNLFVLEDCAQSFGASYGGKRLGAIGTAGAFSFFPSKNLGGFGDGGMVSTNDDQVAALIRMLLKHGGKDKYNVDHIGYNARLDTFQAAILLAKFKYLEEFNSRRRHIAEIYSRELSALEGIILPVVSDELGANSKDSRAGSEELGVKSLQPLAPCLSPLATDSIAHRPMPLACSHVFHQYTIRLEGGQRDVLQTHLKDAGIDSTVYYPVPLQKMSVFEGRCVVHDELKEAERAAHEVLSLPIEPLMTDEEVKAVAGRIKRVCAVGDKDAE